MTFRINDRVKLLGDHGLDHYEEGAICTVQEIGRSGRIGLMSDTDPDTDMLYYVEPHYLIHVTNVPTVRPQSTAVSRAFDTGATRDTDEGKLDFEGFLSPLVIKRYAEHMHAARKMPDGTMRASDNWQLGIPLDVYMKSMWRHFMAVWTSHRFTDEYGIETDLETELCALRFNVDGMLHEILKAKNASDV
jgi:hypothetical protein